MRLILNGQQAFGKACLEAILEQGQDDVVAVHTAPDGKGGRLDPVKEAALAHGLPLAQPESYRDEKVLGQLRASEPDLMVLAFTTVFVPEAAREIPTHGSICFHPSLLPLHRGPSSINWPIIWGAEQTGLTIFWPDDGLDEGEILLRKEVEIGPDDTLGTVYFEKIFPLGVQAVMEAIDLIRAGTAPRIVQDHSRATYESWCRPENVEIDWGRSVAEVYNLIRGANPQPGAWTTHEGERLQIFDAARAEASGRVGEICSVSEAGFTVVAGRGGILVKRVRHGGGAKISAMEFAESAGLTPGTRLGD